MSFDPGYALDRGFARFMGLFFGRAWREANLRDLQREYDPQGYRRAVLSDLGLKEERPVARETLEAHIRKNAEAEEFSTQLQLVLASIEEQTAAPILGAALTFQAGYSKDGDLQGILHLYENRAVALHYLLTLDDLNDEARERYRAMYEGVASFLCKYGGYLADHPNPDLPHDFSEQVKAAETHHDGAGELNR